MTVRSGMALWIPCYRVLWYIRPLGTTICMIVAWYSLLTLFDGLLYFITYKCDDMLAIYHFDYKKGFAGQIPI